MQRKELLCPREPQTVDMKCAQLLVVSPDHGRVIYQWEKKIMLDWVPVSVPSDTCLLYARASSRYLFIRLPLHRVVWQEKGLAELGGTRNHDESFGIIQ